MASDLPERVKAAARGLWIETFVAAGIDFLLLDGRGHPCPRCGGRDRFSAFGDVAERGAVICRHCFHEKNGDGLATIAWYRGWSFRESLAFVADHLHIELKHIGNSSKPGCEPDSYPVPINSTEEKLTGLEARRQRRRDLAKQLQRHRVELSEKNIGGFLERKRPATLESVKAAGGLLAYWPAGSYQQHLCVVFSAYRVRGIAEGVILYRADGLDFPAMGKLPARKTHTVRGSRDGWVAVGGFEQLNHANVVWRTEGIPDALALHPHLPDAHVVVSNICGAGAAAKCALGVFKDKTVFVVPDADIAGEIGAAAFAEKVAKIARDVRIVNLPFDKETDNAATS